MDTKTRAIALTTAILGIVSIILSAYAWSQISRLSLPLPLAIPIISLAIPLLTPIALHLANRILNNFSKRRATLSIALAYVSTLLPVVMLVLSFVHGLPTPLLSCNLETQWLRLFRNKDAASIRAIQDTLRCCGLNSLRDRAWPFPSKGIAADECERAQGYHIRCVDPWRRQESTAAALVGLANFSNWIVVALLIYLMQFRDERLQMPRLFIPRGIANSTTRLLSDRGVDEEIEEQGHSAGGQGYTALPASEHGEHA